MLNRIVLAAAATLVLAAAAPAQERAIPMLVDAEWLAQNRADPTLLVVQVEQRRELYDGGHIPGASFLLYGDIAIEVDGLPVELPPIEDLRSAFEAAGVRDGVRVVLYGAPLSATRAWMTLDYLGVSDRVAVLDGGMAAWQAADQPVSTEPQTPATGSLTLDPQPHRIVEADWVLARLDDPTYALIDARPASEYTGADEGRGRYLAGHIPGAVNLYWEELIHSQADPRLLPEAELRAKLEAAGAGEGRTVVAYCTIGMRASVLYFVSRLLDYPTVLYDGSWHDWSARGLPAVTGPDPLPVSR